MCDQRKPRHSGLECFKSCNVQCHKRASDACADTQLGTAPLLHLEAAHSFHLTNFLALWCFLTYKSHFILLQQVLCATFKCLMCSSLQYKDKVTEFVSKNLKLGKWDACSVLNYKICHSNSGRNFKYKPSMQNRC